MQIVDNIIILLLPVLAFIAGKKVSDHYHAQMIEHIQYYQRLMAAKDGIGYVVPPQKRAPIGQPFMDKLKQNGKAVQSLNHT